MWPYWRDDKGTHTALRDYYPEAMQRHPELRMFLAQIDASQAAIDAFMRNIADAEGEDVDEAAAE
jgi:hypothetical protein